MSPRDYIKFGSCALKYSRIEIHTNDICTEFG